MTYSFAIKRDLLFQTPQASAAERLAAFRRRVDGSAPRRVVVIPDAAEERRIAHFDFATHMPSALLCLTAAYLDYSERESLCKHWNLSLPDFVLSTKICFQATKHLVVRHVSDLAEFRICGPAFRLQSCFPSLSLDLEMGNPALINELFTHCPLITEIQWRPNPFDGEETIALARDQQATGMTLGRPPIPKFHLPWGAFARLTALQSLRVSAYDQDEAPVNLAPLIQMKTLRHIDFSFSPWLTIDATQFGKITSLETLRLGRHGSDAALAAFGDLTSLLTLDIAQSIDRVTDIGIAHIARRTTLTALNVGQCGITSRSLPFIASLPELRTLSCNGCNRILSVNALAHHRRLTSLNLRKCHGLSDAGLTQIGTLPSLTHLDLTHCSINDATLGLLFRLINLRTLLLEDCTALTDKGISRLAQCRELRTLSLKNCWLLTDEGVLSLVNLPLESLDLGGSPQVTNEGFASLSDCHTLKSLSAAGSLHLTDWGLSRLARCRALNSLDLTGCKQKLFEEQSKEQLFPNVTIKGP